MPTTQGNRPILDLKRWEFLNPAPVATSAGVFVVPSQHVRQQLLYVVNNTTVWLYPPEADAFVSLASPALAGVFGAGACGAACAFSTGSTTAAASLTATGGTTSTIVTNQPLARDLRGFSVHIMAGPNAGLTLPIVSNTIGANATITVAAQASAFSASTVYRLVTPRWFVIGAGTLASGSFKSYDFATNNWNTLSITGLAATLGTDARLVSTPSWDFEDYSSIATGTATAGGGSTLTNSGKSWTTNQWTNYQIRITGGTGAGQIRTIASNTGTVITASAAWTITPDSTSTYSIEGNDDYLYLIGNNAITLYRYSISANTWTTLSPTSARAAAPGAGMSGHWVCRSGDAAWADEAAIINGRRIYGLRGGGSSVLDYYDIALNTWVSGVTYSPSNETFTTGTSYALIGGSLYIHKEATGRFLRLNFVTSELDPWSTITYTQGAAVLGDKVWTVQYVDGATTIRYVYTILHTSNVVLRQMVI